jgi:hypothetical protein
MFYRLRDGVIMVGTASMRLPWISNDAEGCGLIRSGVYEKGWLLTDLALTF